MSDSPLLPGQHGWKDASGKPLPVEFYRFLRDLVAYLKQAGANDAAIADLEARVAALEAGGTDAVLQGLESVQIAGSLAGGLVKFRLDGDVQSPGPTLYYGTDAAGAKGFHAIADAVAAEPGELTKAVSVDGVTTFGLADVIPASGGTLQLTQFDTKGRRSHEGAADTDDLPEGAANLYFTAARVRETVLTGLSLASSAVITAADTVLSALGKLQAQVSGKEPAIATGTTGQFWRGDKTWSNTLTGNLVINQAAASYNAISLNNTGGVETQLVANGNNEGKAGTITNHNLVLIANNVTRATIRPGASSRSSFIGGLESTGSVAAVYFQDRVNASNSGAWYSNANFAILNHTVGGDLVDVSLAQGLRPGASITSGTMNLGSSARLWNTVYAANSAINTSDAREKTTPRSMSAEELSAAKEIAALPCVYQWLSAIEAKGDGARLHISPTVQDVIACMDRQGLDPFRYGFVCYDKWDEVPEQRDPETGDVVQEYRPAGDRYSLRPSELGHFLVVALHERVSALETA